MLVSSAVFDSGGRKVLELDAAGALRGFEYDGADRVTRVYVLNYLQRDGTARVVELETSVYLANGLVASKTEGGLRVTTSSYDPAGRLTEQVLDPGGAGHLDRVSVLHYDEAGNEVTRSLSDGSRTEEVRRTYTDSGLVASETIENGTVDLTTATGYDDRGLPVAVTDAEGETVETAFDEAGRAFVVTSPAVTVEEAGQGGVIARPQAMTGYDSFGSVTETVDARGARTVGAFDRLGRLVSTVYPDYLPPGGTVPVSPVESVVYDAAGRPLVQVDRRGQATDLLYDGLGRLVRTLGPAAAPGGERPVSRFGYDDAGHQLWALDARGARTESSWDLLGRQRSSIQVVRNAGPTPDRYTTTFDYDDLGNQVYVQDADGNVTTSVFSPAGEKLSETAPGGATTSYAYDVGSRILATTDPLGRSARSIFDLAGRETELERYDPGGVLLSRESRRYDGNGNVVATVSARGNENGVDPEDFTTTMGYDALGRLVGISRPVSETVSVSTGYGYDAAGNLTRWTDGDGHVTRYGFNSWNLAESTIEPQVDSEPSTFVRVYEAGGIAVRDDLPGGVSVTRNLDLLGRVTSESASGPGVVPASRSFTYDAGGLMQSAGSATAPAGEAGSLGFAYDDRGLLLSASGPAGESEFVYDSLGRMTQRSDAAGISLFGWDARSRLVQAADPLTGVTRHLVWDEASQLESVQFGSGTDVPVESYAYDDLGRLLSSELRDGTGEVSAAYGYGYDADSNLVSQSITLPGNPASGSHGYGYDNAGRLSSWTAPSGAVALYDYDGAGNRVRAGDGSFVFDARNRVISGAGKTYTWNPAGTMASVSGPDGTTTYDFDALGRQTAVDDPGDGLVATTYDSLDRVADRNGTAFAYAGVEIDPVTDGETVLARSPAGIAVAQTRNGQTGFVGRNRHGDSTYTFDTTGTVTSATVFDPWGTKTATSGTEPSAFGYQGDYTDPDTGQVWQGARWYQPDLGAFSSRDTILGDATDPSSLNRYAYGNNDPLQNWDPDGHYACDDPRNCKPPKPPKSKSGKSKGGKSKGGKSKPKGGEFEGEVFLPAGPTVLQPQPVLEDIDEDAIAAVMLEALGALAGSEEFEEGWGDSSLLEQIDLFWAIVFDVTGVMDSGKFWGKSPEERLGIVAKKGEEALNGFLGIVAQLGSESFNPLEAAGNVISSLDDKEFYLGLWKGAAINGPIEFVNTLFDAVALVPRAITKLVGLLGIDTKDAEEMLDLEIPTLECSEGAEATGCSGGALIFEALLIVATLLTPIPGDEAAAIARAGTREATALAGEAGEGASSFSAARGLGRQLASEEQMAEVGTRIAGTGTKAPLRGAGRIADQYGGSPGDWVKVSSSPYKGPDGFQFETHWYENIQTGERVEFKTKFPDNSNVGFK